MLREQTKSPSLNHLFFNLLNHLIHPDLDLLLSLCLLLLLTFNLLSMPLTLERNLLLATHTPCVPLID